MADNTKIEWARHPVTGKGASWNPIRARNLETGKLGHFCVHVSEGCRNCYAERLQPRFQNPVRYAESDRAKIKYELDKDALLQPLRWKTPRGIFVESMADLFEKGVPFWMIDRIYAVMALCQHHVFFVLTKRPERARNYVEDATLLNLDMVAQGIQLAAPQRKGAQLRIPFARDLAGAMNLPWPLPNLWLGTSAEDQPTWETRVRYLRETPAAVRFVSAEPLLGPIIADLTKINWLIAGGESGPKARPTHPEWIRSLRDQCRDAGTAFFFKQWGEWAPVCEMTEEQVDGCYKPAPVRHPDRTRKPLVPSHVLHNTGERFDAAERGAFIGGSGAMTMFEIGKKAAGRQLDGVEHNGMPTVLEKETA